MLPASITGDLLDLREGLFGKKRLVIAAGIGLGTVAMGDFLRGLGVVLARRPHADGKRAQHRLRGQPLFRDAWGATRPNRREKTPLRGLLPTDPQ